MLLCLSIQQYIIECAMNLFNSVTYLTTLVGRTKQSMRNLTQNGPTCNESFELKPQKGAINDTTMETIPKLDENSCLTIPFDDHSFSCSHPSKKKQVQYRPPGLLSMASQKRHENIAYFDAQGRKIDSAESVQRYTEQSGQQKKRVLSLAGQTYEQEASRLLRKYIKNDEIPMQREEDYLEVQSEMANGTIRHIYGDKDQQAVIKITFRKNVQQCSNKKNKYCIHQSDLPNLGDYQINYSMNELAQMTYEQISSLQGLAISASWGRLQFLQPVSLYRKDLEDCVTLSPDSIEIHGEDWKRKPFQLIVFNKYKSMNALKSIKEEALALGLNTMKETESSELLIFKK